MPVALIRKGLLHSAIKKRKKELRSLRNHATVYEKDLAKSLSFIDKYINKYILILININILILIY